MNGKPRPFQGRGKVKKKDYFPLIPFSGQFSENGGREPTPQYREEDPRREGRVVPLMGRNPQDPGEPSRRGGGQLLWGKTEKRIF